MKQETLDRVNVVGVLPSGKSIGWREIGCHSFKEICFKEGGEIPSELGGMWTDPFAIQRAITSYIIKKKNEAFKEKANQSPKKAEKGK